MRVPTRVEIEEKWIDFSEGRTSREDVRDWACSFDRNTIADVMVRDGLGWLAGFAMISDEANHHGITDPPPVGEYLRSRDFIAKHLDHWRRRCAEVDADPERWRKVDYGTLFRLPDGASLSGTLSTSRKALFIIGNILNAPVAPDGRSGEGSGHAWTIADIIEDGKVLVLEVHQ
jgi:hypothetical protein